MEKTNINEKSNNMEQMTKIKDRKTEQELASTQTWEQSSHVYCGQYLTTVMKTQKVE